MFDTLSSSIYFDAINEQRLVFSNKGKVILGIMISSKQFLNSFQIASMSTFSANSGNPIKSK